MKKEHEKRFLEFLSSPSSYNYNPGFIKVVQTHISMVAIAPPFVYKVKKNIKLDFLDYSSMEKRKYFLERELELNRRLCSHVYLEIVPVYEFEGLLSFEKFFHATPHIFDYALKMNYLEPQYSLISLLQQRDFDYHKMDLLIRRLATFYKNKNLQKPTEEFSEHGKPAAINQMFQKNLHELLELSAGAASRRLLHTVSLFTDRFMEAHKTGFQSRSSMGFIKDCHGDLRLEHIYIHDLDVCIYDCIEFNDDFRIIDIANDFAFLLMELDYAGYSAIASTLSRKFFSAMSDSTGNSLLVYYKIYRALVRAKVNWIVSRESEIPLNERNKAEESAEKFTRLALKYALANNEPVVFVIMGKTASGKSTLAAKFSRDCCIPSFSTDATRKRLANIHETTSTPQEIKSQVYSPEFTNQVYQTLLDDAQRELENKGAVLLDGTFSKKKYRDLVFQTFSPNRVLFIEVSAPEAEKKMRLKRRDVTGGVSDARLSDKKIIDSLYEPPDELKASDRICIKSSQDAENIADELYDKIIRLNIKTR